MSGCPGNSVQPLTSLSWVRLRRWKEPQGLFSSHEILDKSLSVLTAPFSPL